MSLALTALDFSDADHIHALVRRWETHWQVPIVTPREEIIEDLTYPGFRPHLDTIGTWSGDKLVAYGAVHHTISGVRLERAHLNGMVDPAFSGLGLGRRVLAWQIARATERLRACNPSIPWFVRANEWEWIEDSHRLFARFGLTPVRWFEEMVRPLDTDNPRGANSPTGPGDVRIVEWNVAPSDEIRLVTNETFGDHWGSTPRDRPAWEHLLASSDVRLDLSFVAVVGEEVVGVCLNHHFPSDAEVTGRRDGWIGVLGVTKPWRRRGVATALMTRSFGAFKAAGFTHAMIGVDADNPTGAAGLYRHVGFEPLQRSVTYQLEVEH